MTELTFPLLFFLKVFLQKLKKILFTTKISSNFMMIKIGKMTEYTPHLSLFLEFFYKKQISVLFTTTMSSNLFHDESS